MKLLDSNKWLPIGFVNGPSKRLENSLKDVQKAFLRALRPHQWLKNVLVFVPLFTAQDWDGTHWGLALVAFTAFSLCSSGVYLLNDLVDLSNDRADPRKCHRPLANKSLPLNYALVATPMLMAVGLFIGGLVRPTLLVVLVLYLVATTAYSFFLKRKVLVDVLILAGLYVLRVVGGAFAVGLAVSHWLLAFSLFFFLALAIIKRYTELADYVARGKGAPCGRGYRTDDLPVLSAMGAASGFTGVQVLALYINSSAVQQNYSTPQWLWLIPVLVLYWLARVLLLSYRGQMHDDPVVFAFEDPTSLSVGALVLLVVVVATL